MIETGQLGNLAIWLALAMAVATAASYLISALGKKNLFRLGSRAYSLQTIFVAVAFSYLYYLFFTHNFAIRYVFEYSSSDLPFFYLLSSFWGGQEGTYLLWFFLSSLFGLVILKKGRLYTGWGMFFHSLIHIFLAIILLTLSPFRPLEFHAHEGAGLNPLLQDPWMVAHPPAMFVAFAMAGIPFALALAAMIKKDYSQWLKISLPYTAITSLALIIANVLGGYWAYKTLGWGGYWAWDPVENTSFVPWAVSIALIHGMLVERRSGALRRANLLLTGLIFFLIIYGTFLTRSGVLADFSVHSFVDLGVNGILVGSLIGFLALTLGVFILSRSPGMSGKPLNYNIFSRDFILFAGMALFLILGIVVEFWSSLPLITRYLTANPAAAEIETYNSFAFPFAIIISLFLTLSPTLVGPGIKVERLRSKSLVAAVIAIAIAGTLYAFHLINPTIAVTLAVYIAVLIIYIVAGDLARKFAQALICGGAGVIIALILGVRSFEYFFFIGASLAAAGAHVNLIIQYISRRPELVGGHLCHFGFGVMLVGILASSAFSVNEQVVIPRHENRTAFGYKITYSGMAGSIADKDNALLLTVERDGSKTEARPKFFYTERMNGMMKKPYIKKTLLNDIYFAPQDVQESPGAEGLKLHKGESATVGEFNVKFIGFDMSSHGTASGMSVGATLEVEFQGIKDTVVPKVVSNPMGEGMISEKAKLFGGQDFEIIIEQIYASEGAVSLSIPGLIEAGPPDRLILDISRKPGINLLWLGALIIFAGMGLMIYYRFHG
jgi:cytochrome c-type biogenesis protein CcmF